MPNATLPDRLQSLADDLEYYRRANAGHEREAEFAIAAALVREAIAALITPAADELHRITVEEA